MVGERIAQYRITAPLGRGSTGVVYKAVDETLGRDVAIKVLRGQSADADRMARFRGEAGAIARLNHPAIAAVHELLEDESRLVMVMEFVNGQTLERICARTGRFSVGDATYYIDQILWALDHAHRAGVVHCDIKPSNVMVTLDGGIKIMDFGTAQTRGGHSGAGGVMGTPAYMAPEQLLGHAVDGRADLYATGVLFYRLLTGTLPFVGDTTVVVARKQLNETHASARTHCSTLPDWCDHILAKALAKTPEQRFHSALQFRDALRTAAAWPAPKIASVNAESAAAAPPKRKRSRFPPRRAIGLIAAALLMAFATLLASLDAVDGVEPGRIEPPAAPRLPVADPIAAVAAPPSDSTPLPGRLRKIADGAPPAIESAPAGATTEAAVEEPHRSAPREPTVASVFEARVLEGDGPRAALRDCELVLGNHGIDIRDSRQRELRAIPYDGVKSIDYTRGPEPSPRSATASTAFGRMTGGFLRLFSGRHHWLTLQTRRTSESPVVLQFGREEDATRAIAALQARTGRRAAAPEHQAPKLSPMSPE